MEVKAVKAVKTIRAMTGTREDKRGMETKVRYELQPPACGRNSQNCVQIIGDFFTFAGVLNFNGIRAHQ